MIVGAVMVSPSARAATRMVCIIRVRKSSNASAVKLAAIVVSTSAKAKCVYTPNTTLGAPGRRAAIRHGPHRYGWGTD